MKKALTFIGQFVLTFGSLFLIYLIIVYFIQNKKEIIDKEGKITVCEVINEGYNKSSYVEVIYMANGKEFIKRETTYFSAPENIPIGEKYMIKYDSINPQNAYVMFEYPFFDENEKTNIVSGKIEKITDRNVVFFCYFVGSKQYKRFQKLPDTVICEINKYYTVKYLISDPLRSIILVQ